MSIKGAALRVAVAARLRAPKRSSHRSAIPVPYWLLSPSLVPLVVIVFVPMAFAFYISLTGLNQNTIGDWTHAPFVGLKHYLDGLDPRGPLAPSFYSSIKASVIFSVATTLFILPIGVGAALLLNGSLRGRTFLRAVMLLPYIIPTFVNGILWRLVFMTSTGIADQVMAALHLGSRDTFWLIGPRSLWALVLADVWASWPFIYLMALAALQTIPADVPDAAKIDGATPLRIFRHITLPLIAPTLGLGIALSTINHFNNFALPYVMFGPTPPDEVNVMPLNIYVNSFITFNLGLGAAMSVVALLIMLTPAVIYLRAARVGDD
ncbi:MAG TPA: sugar ABC transporter permease [Candidatus Dormibacteraeota bacterium]|nr:sugar ABC transporter permease [Candidatus Dormibacteraeota bacterium]